MQQSHLELIVGCRAETRCGQWIESTICLPKEDSFVFRADMCRRDENGSFSLWRLDEMINLSLTAVFA